MLTGSCLCGDIAFEVHGEITEMIHCHCSMCRKLHGGSFATFGVTDPATVRWRKGVDAVSHYRSSEQGGRTFCPRCGSTVPAVSPGGPVTYIPMGNVAEDPGTRPSQHFFAGSRAPWHTIVDDLPQYADWPPGWGDPVIVEREPREPDTPGAIAGSCQCGAVRYEFDAAERMANCHCSRCRRQMASAYATFVFAAADAFRWLAGDADVVNYKMPEARVKGTAFCRHCGSLVPREREPGAMQIPAGSLDTDPGLRPGANIFTGSMAPWTTLDTSIACFEEYPTG